MSEAMSENENEIDEPIEDESNPTDDAFASGEIDEVETRDEEMDRLREAADSADKRVLMAQAEAENFRKRMRRDYEDQLKYAAVPLVSDILQVRDNLWRALEAAESSEDNAGLKEGVAMVAKQLDDQLAKHGVKEIPAAGELFDPNFHEAISQMPSPDHAEGMVAHVAATGFQMHERVIRPSQVVVSTGSPA
jgi:molecular chaperone GrpE